MYEPIAGDGNHERFALRRGSNGAYHVDGRAIPAAEDGAGLAGAKIGQEVKMGDRERVVLSATLTAVLALAEKLTGEQLTVTVTDPLGMEWRFCAGETHWTKPGA